MMISIIVPVYNIEELVTRCVQSIQQQTYEDLEILLVDDGSTDQSGHLCDELAKQDDRIHVIHKKNGGSSSARNTGIEAAQGDYLGFVDSDDYIEPDMYERMMDAFQSNDGSKKPMMVQIGRDEMDADGNRLADICTPPEKKEFIYSNDFMKELLIHKGDCSFCTKLVDKALFTRLRFPEGVLNEDFHLLVQMLTEINGIVSLPGYGYHVYYRIGSNTRKKTSNEFSRVYADCIDNADYVYTLVVEHFPELKDVAVRFGIFQRLEYLLHIPTGLMRNSYAGYSQVKRYLRHNCRKGMNSVYLTKRNKVHLLIFCICPAVARRVHKVWMGLRKER